MHLSAEVTRGVRAIRRLLREQTCDLRGLDVPAFRRWLDERLAHWRHDPVFAQQRRIRDLRHAHPELRRLERERRRAAAADAAAPSFARLQALEQERGNAAKAITGLTAALHRATSTQRPALQRKLHDFQARRAALDAEQARLLRSSPERQALLRLDAELHQLRAALGLDREEASLNKLLKQQGRRSGRSGASFEQASREWTRTLIVPELTRGNVRVLSGVTLGAARVEFDQLVVRTMLDGPVEVLAVVEVKRNINDLAHGFLQRLENLAWLTGDTRGYDPQTYRTRHFRTGHFDREALHAEGQETFRFTRDSFRRFRRDAVGLIPDRLYFVTRTGPLWGLSAAALARLRHRVATEEETGGRTATRTCAGC